MRWEQHPHPEGGTVHVWRDDLYEVAGVRGGKARTCWALTKQALARGAPGLVTAGSRHSPQVNLVAQIGHACAVPVRAYVPTGPMTPELALAEAAGAELVRVSPGYNSVIVARANADARESGWQLVPFGMECPEVLEEVAPLVGGLPLLTEGARLVVPVGSGMTLAALLWGLERTPYAGLRLLGVCVGADPTARLNRWAPPSWNLRASLGHIVLERSALAYADEAPGEWQHALGFRLDPIYEAKCYPYLRPSDALWVVGIRQAALAGRG